MDQSLDARLSHLLDTGHTVTLSTGGETLDGDVDAPTPTWHRADVTICNSDAEVVINLVGDNPLEVLSEAATALTQRYASDAKEPTMELTGRLISTSRRTQLITELDTIDPDYSIIDGQRIVTGWTTPDSPAPGEGKRRLRLEMSDGVVLEGDGHVESIRTRPIDTGPHARRLVIRIDDV
ncbi:hypothetical protein [Actinomadura rubrisoli]|uniref:Uncharacterized protein n=1 Tax=Actinomadura rubrisoli TaxID=2530368 RepID=A0A4R5CGQ9_9ACTN|nr:hypothetical protein [Actinomadura rubrisoli]TDD97670.1 hypothetical protein E1298_01145 [Actinomadura rubrisoli]